MAMICRLCVSRAFGIQVRALSRGLLLHRINTPVPEHRLKRSPYKLVINRHTMSFSPGTNRRLGLLILLTVDCLVYRYGLKFYLLGSVYKKTSNFGET